MIEKSEIRIETRKKKILKDDKKCQKLTNHQK